MITATNLVKTFGSGGSAVRALDDVSLAVGDGEIAGVVGKSGAGKSTLIRTINALERPDSGTVEVAGRPISSLTGEALRTARHDIGMIFQHFNLLSSRTVAGNVALALELIGSPRGERKARVAEILELVGLSDKAKSYPAQLSGGQKQRVGIARALASRPKVLLSDESTSALDPETTQSILDLLASLNRELGLTILLITHEMEVVKRICTRAALMEDGRIVEQGALTELLRTKGSRISRNLFPLGELPAERGTTVLDLTFTELASEHAVIARLAREFEIDVSILGATIETVAGQQTGRTRLELPAGTDRDAVIRDLEGHGIVVDIVRGGAA
ncbi:methionine ABC transporter ATP-binding protein [Agromyces archimandritae]|uniref:ATP-binding cassette domain-containing protein n=1 Tax=Agromyces archimandritae TaxID=2781962 RepID=A0A975FLS4_9MICO|nr:ATP-binding cassette domain-containing protein [Agromyces archimandritae]QTX04242.1 ATP-binding cassette domain-containing protein [Agromyces archimandritae]